ncbi:hypothetical protein ACO0QE_002893 [Hanseniaspora vineae]
MNLQLIWFIGHCFTLIGTIFFVLSGFSSNSSYTFLYTGVILSFGIQLYQQYFKQLIKPTQEKPTNTNNTNTTRLNKARVVIRDVNFPYFTMALIWLITPLTTLSVFPYAIFSMFHALTYTKNVLIPQYFPNLNKFTPYINVFLQKYQDLSMSMSANFEVYCLLLLILKNLMFWKWTLMKLVQFAGYTLFIKLRLESSKILSNAFAHLSFQFENLLARVQHNNPGNTMVYQVKNYYIAVKMQCKRLNSVNLTNYLAGPPPQASSASSSSASGSSRPSNERKQR